MPTLFEKTQEHIGTGNIGFAAGFCTAALVICATVGMGQKPKTVTDATAIGLLILTSVYLVFGDGRSLSKGFALGIMATFALSNYLREDSLLDGLQRIKNKMNK